MNVLDYKGTDSSRYKAMMMAVRLTTLFLCLFTLGRILAPAAITETMWTFVAGVWAAAITTGLISYSASESVNKLAAAKANELEPVP